MKPTASEKSGYHDWCLFFGIQHSKQGIFFVEFMWCNNYFHLVFESSFGLALERSRRSRGESSLHCQKLVLSTRINPRSMISRSFSKTISENRDVKSKWIFQSFLINELQLDWVFLSELFGDMRACYEKGYWLVQLVVQEFPHKRFDSKGFGSASKVQRRLQIEWHSSHLSKDQFIARLKMRRSGDSLF